MSCSQVTASHFQVTHHVVTRKRVAAFCVAYDHALRARDDQACLIRLVIGISHASQKACGERRQSFPKAELTEQFIGIRQAKFVKSLAHTHLAYFAQRRSQVFQRAIEQAFAEVGRFAAAHVFHALANSRAGLGRGYKSYPVWIGLSAARGNDFDSLAVFQRRTEWHKIAINFRRYATIADIRVHGIRKINRRCTQSTLTLSRNSSELPDC